MSPRILWVGLGNMGRGMCKNLAEKGNLDQPLIIYNRSIQRALDLTQTLPSGKTEVAESIEDGVSRADIIFTCIADDAAVSEAITNALNGDVKGKLFIECSTIHPDTTESLAKDVVAHGAEFVAVPVFGAPAVANAGQLIAVMAGPKSSVDRARPYFKGVMARAEIDMSDQPYQKASILKLAGNSFFLTLVEQIAESHVLAEKTDLGTSYLHQFIELMFPGLVGYSNRMLSGDYHKREEPLFAVDLARKDARHIMGLAARSGTRMLNIETADAHLAKVKDCRGVKGDMAGIYGAVRQEAGMKFENEV